MAWEGQGSNVESYVRWLAGHLGVADFVYRPTIVTKGSGVRELSDGLLVAGSSGLIIQTKSRNDDAARKDDAERAERWCRKHALRARQQGFGTRRRLSEGNLHAVSLRGHERLLPRGEDWPIVVVLHHPKAPRITLVPSVDTLYLTFEDWLGLHSLIRSTHGLISYVRRALAAPIEVPLGAERERYRELAAADVRWASFSSTAVPVLPPRPLTEEERFAADLFSELMEMVADPSSLGWDSEQYLRFIDRLDRTPTLARTEIGMKMIRTFEAMVESHSRRSFGVMDAETGARLMVLYDYDPAPVVDLSDKSFAARLAAYTALRHIHAVEAQLDADAGTLGVGIVHHPTEGRRYNFALLEGAAPHLPRDLRESLEHEFGVFTGTSVVPRSAAPNT